MLFGRPLKLPADSIGNLAMRNTELLVPRINSASCRLTKLKVNRTLVSSPGDPNISSTFSSSTGCSVGSLGDGGISAGEV